MKLKSGVAAVSHIFAIRGGMAERVLREIAEGHKNVHGLSVRPRLVRRTDGWNGDECTVWVSFGENRSISIRLLLVDSEEECSGRGVLLIDKRFLRTFTVSPLPESNGIPQLGIGEHLSETMLRRAANQIVASWISHGHGWTDGRGNTFSEPWGEEKKERKKRTSFRGWSRARRHAREDHGIRW